MADVEVEVEGRAVGELLGREVDDLCPAEVRQSVEVEHAQGRLVGRFHRGLGKLHAAPGVVLEFVRLRLVQAIRLDKTAVERVIECDHVVDAEEEAHGIAVQLAQARVCVGHTVGFRRVQRHVACVIPVVTTLGACEVDGALALPFAVNDPTCIHAGVTVVGTVSRLDLIALVCQGAACLLFLTWKPCKGALRSTVADELTVITIDGRVQIIRVRNAHDSTLGT
mmetsp:Transcript_18702/g.72163  ORF Transcript_18702/g.72163 Transcript_18702/m.72163 type:complete len:224 (-) Transcript_18702:281-952(-)